MESQRKPLIFTVVTATPLFRRSEASLAETIKIQDKSYDNLSYLKVQHSCSKGNGSDQLE